MQMIKKKNSNSLLNNLHDYYLFKTTYSIKTKATTNISTFNFERLYL